MVITSSGRFTPLNPTDAVIVFAICQSGRQSRRKSLTGRYHDGQMIGPARKVAFNVLRKTEEGGYASDLLLSHTEGLDSRDAGLASEIVFGCLRRQAQLDW